MFKFRNNFCISDGILSLVLNKWNTKLHGGCGISWRGLCEWRVWRVKIFERYLKKRVSIVSDINICWNLQFVFSFTTFKKLYKILKITCMARNAATEQTITLLNILNEVLDDPTWSALYNIYALWIINFHTPLVLSKVIKLNKIILMLSFK